jgi:hypothetical protein
MKWLNSAAAFLLYTAVMLVTYYSAILWPSAYFLAFATQFTIGFGAYLAKQLIQKQEKYNPICNGGANEKRPTMD